MLCRNVLLGTWDRSSRAGLLWHSDHFPVMPAFAAGCRQETPWGCTGKPVSPSFLMMRLARPCPYRLSASPPPSLQANWGCTALTACSDTAARHLPSCDSPGFGMGPFPSSRSASCHTLFLAPENKDLAQSSVLTVPDMGFFTSCWPEKMVSERLLPPLPSSHRVLRPGKGKAPPGSTLPKRFRSCATAAC